jgi:enterochelin esterase-like enzyme
MRREGETVKRAVWRATVPAVLAILAATAIVPALHAQGRSGPIVSPEIGADHRVTFRIRAPKATEVEVSLNLGAQAAAAAGATKAPEHPGNWSVPMHKGADGVWAVTLALEPDVYRYAFAIDGVRVLDLANRNVSGGGLVHWSYFDLPGSPSRFDEVRDVPHGSVQLRTYRVSGNHKLHTVAIYVPPDYDRDTSRAFPVLYLFHGGGDAEEGWVRLGRVPAIAENLLAAHKAVPMLVVMPNCDDNGNATSPEAVAAFNSEILDDVMPLVEKNYRVEKTREGRAVAGRANGATQAFALGLKHLDLFAWVAALSPGAPISSPTYDLNAHVPGLTTDPAAINKKVKLLFVSVGTEDTRYQATVRLDKLLTENGIHHEFHTTPGEHEWKVWRPMLAELMPKLFQPAK